MPISIQNSNPNPNPNPKPKKLISLFIKCVIMALFLSLFLIFLLFLGFAALVLLHFLITSTAFHRRHRRRHNHHHRSPANPTSTSSFDLPCVSYCGSPSDCAICLEGFKEGEFCRKLPDCGHFFHVKCVDNWLMRVLNCPICRTRVRVGSGSSGCGVSDDDWKRWWAVGVSG